MRVAVLSDIHGNLPALEAVLAKLEQEPVDRIVLNGDIAAGPLPSETLDRVLGLGNRAIWVRGNGDRALAEGRGGGVPDEVLELARLLSAAQRKLLADLSLTASLEVDGLGTVLFCHGSPRSDEEMLLVDSPPGRFAAAFESIDADLVVLGHTHMPFDRLVGGRRVINPGSVGMPYGHSGAAWAVLGPRVDLRRTSYDVDAAVERLLQSAWAGARAWTEVLLHQYDDIEVLDHFTQLAEQQSF